MPYEELHRRLKANESVKMPKAKETPILPQLTPTPSSDNSATEKSFKPLVIYSFFL